MATVKLTEQELEKIAQMQTDYATITAQLGQLKIEQMLVRKQLQRLDELESNFESEYLKLQTTEQEFAKEIESKYGTGEINLETGEFIQDSPTV